MPHRTRTRRAPRAIAIAAASIGLLLSAPAAASADCAGADLRSADQNTVALEESILCLINERRASAGVGPVRLSFRLAQAASRHSNDMVSSGFFSHTSPSGSTFIDRITSSGYTKGARSWLVGENLAWGAGSLSTPANLVEAWMESPPHRANLLRGRFKEIGLSGVRGTPSDGGEADGITVSSEYGYRAVKKSARKARKSRKARGRRS